MTRMSVGLDDVPRLLWGGATYGEPRPGMAMVQCTVESWEAQIAYCQKHRALLSRRDEQFVDDLARREPTASRIRHLHAIAAAIRRDPRSSGG